MSDNKETIGQITCPVCGLSKAIRGKIGEQVIMPSHSPCHVVGLNVTIRQISDKLVQDEATQMWRWH